MTSLRICQAEIPGRLHSTDLVLEGGEMVAVVGPNGGGKTSLLRAIAGVEQAGGDVLFGAERLSSLQEARRRALLAFLPATRDIHWPIPARDVIAMGSNAAGRDDIDRAIEQLELDSLADRPMDRLSTGERTRVMLARCMVGQPALLLLDEPLSNLDPYWALRILDLLTAEAERGAIVLASLHDLDRLARFSRALLIADGKVQMDEAPATLLGSERFEDIFRVRKSDDGWAISRPADRQSSR